jgi:IS1 family transposase
VAFKKKLKATLEFYEQSREKLAISLTFDFSVMDELFTFVGNKHNRYYVWASMIYTPTGKPFYFYRLSHHRTADELFEFEVDLPKVDEVYADEAFAYDKIYGDAVHQGKNGMTNKIENLNSQMRDKISYLVRRSKAHAKSALWLNYRLARFFNQKNLGG